MHLTWSKCREALPVFGMCFWYWARYLSWSAAFGLRVG